MEIIEIVIIDEFQALISCYPSCSLSKLRCDLLSLYDATQPVDVIQHYR